MTREEIIERLRSTAPALKAEGVTGLAIFGSRARGDARDDSDLDVLVEIDESRRLSLLDIIDIEHLIQDLTGIPTQIEMRRSIEPRFARRIADDVIKVF